MKKAYLLIGFLIISFVITNSSLAAADPYYYKQWYLPQIKAPEAWTVTKGSTNIIVAVLDTGLDMEHPDIKDNIWRNLDEIPGDKIDNDGNGYIDDVNGWDFVDKNNTPSPKLSGKYSVPAVDHGTFVAGLISAVHDNGQGIKGVTANVKIMPLRVLDSEGYGTSATVTSAMDYAIKNGADIINLSFGGYDYSSSLKNKISEAYSKGILIVAAAGNMADSTASTGVDLTDKPIYPICYDQQFTENKILGVVASTKQNKPAAFSNYGKGCIDIAAPGEDFIGLVYHDNEKANLSAYYEEGWNGNSFSAALVSGAAALLKSVKPELTPKQLIETLMQESGLLIIDNPKYNGKVGAGLLDIKKALDKVYTPAVTTTPVVATPVTGTTPTPIVSNAQIIVSTKAKGLSSVMIYNSSLTRINEIEVLKGEEFQGLNVQVADVNGGDKEIIVGAARGATPFVRVLDSNGTIVSSFLGFDANFKGGVEVAAGDIDADGQVEIIVAPESGYAPVIKIFDLNGKLKKEFYAYNESFTNGINVAVGDVDADGKPDIVVAPHQGLMPKIKIFDGQGTLKKELVVYSPQFTGGVNIALANVNGTGPLEIITGAGPGGGPHVQVLTYQGTKLASFMAYSASFTGGVEVAAGDWNGDGNIEIITAAGPGGGPHVKIFNSWGGYLNQFFPLPNTFTNGINIAIK